VACYILGCHEPVNRTVTHPRFGAIASCVDHDPHRRALDRTPAKRHLDRAWVKLVEAFESIAPVSEGSDEAHAGERLPVKARTITGFLASFEAGRMAAATALGLGVSCSARRLLQTAERGTFGDDTETLISIVESWNADEIRTLLDKALLALPAGADLAADCRTVLDRQSFPVLVYLFLCDVGRLIDPSMATTSVESVILRWPEITTDV
jgi:hypothetical protein